MRIFTFLTLFVCIVQSLHGAVELQGNYDWTKARTLCKGIKYMQFELKTPRLMKMAAARVDLQAQKFRFKVNGRAAEWGRPMPEDGCGDIPIRTLRMTCREFMKESVKSGDKMVLAVNGSPWIPWKEPWNHRYAAKLGLHISDGVLVSEANKRPSFVVFKNGRCDFIKPEGKDDFSDIMQAISGFGFVLSGGVPSGGDKKLAPRTGYGLDKNRRYLYIFVVDGRQPAYSMGASQFEVGQILRYLGADDGLNMDGGGSTTLLIRKNGRIRKLNNHSKGAERKVGGMLGICID